MIGTTTAEFPIPSQVRKPSGWLVTSGWLVKFRIPDLCNTYTHCQTGRCTREQAMDSRPYGALRYNIWEYGACMCERSIRTRVHRLIPPTSSSLTCGIELFDSKCHRPLCLMICKHIVAGYLLCFPSDLKVNTLL